MNTHPIHARELLDALFEAKRKYRVTSNYHGGRVEEYVWAFSPEQAKRMTVARLAKRLGITKEGYTGIWSELRRAGFTAVEVAGEQDEDNQMELF